MTTTTPCHLANTEFRSSMACNLAVVYRIGQTHGELYALSVAGTAQEIQAVAAGLADASLELSWPDLGVDRWTKAVTPARGGFDCRKEKLEYDTWHLVAVSKSKSFFLHETDEALWQQLRSERFTTPILKHWTPAIRQQLHKRGLLTKLDHFGPCSPAYLLASSATLDDVVSHGIQHGLLRIEHAAAAA
jgi:hypothetical protein